MSRIHLFTKDNLSWGFDDSGSYIMLPRKPYPYPEYVDPYPCYPHDIEIVRKEIERNEAIIKLPFFPDYFVLSNEGKSRTSGSACANELWEAENENPKLAPYIILWGKRICHHPAMTRYLVAHELAHVVHYNLKYILKSKNDTFEEEYAKMRGIECNKSYGAGKWHTNIKEIIANDIRICIFDKENEFWPHNAVHPLQADNVLDYWKNIRNKYLQ